MTEKKKEKKKEKVEGQGREESLCYKLNSIRIA